MKPVRIRNFLVGAKRPLTVFCGPCVIESEEFLMQVAGDLKKIFAKHPFQFIFKASYDKANRSSIHSFRGPGLEEGLRILEKVGKEWDLPLISDIHSPEEAQIAAEVLDVLQIPAFLCRQTDLVAAAGNTRAAVNVKKGQFLSPWDMKNVIDKLQEVGQQNIVLTDRGTSFGYNNLVSDMRSIPVMQNFGFPVCFDATHSAQLPGGMGNVSGGQREFIPTLTKAAIAAGANALFIEAHPDPAHAKSDASTVMPYDALKRMLSEVERLYEVVQCFSEASL